MTLSLVLFLHGGGERGNDNESQLKLSCPPGWPRARIDDVSLLRPAPQRPEEMGWSSMPRDDES